MSDGFFKWRLWHDVVVVFVLVLAVFCTVGRMGRGRVVCTSLGGAVVDQFLVTGVVSVVTFTATNGPFITGEYGVWSAGGGVYGLICVTNRL